MTGKRRSYDAPFREGAVRIVLETGKPAAEVARDLGVHESSAAAEFVAVAAASVPAADAAAVLRQQPSGGCTTTPVRATRYGTAHPRAWDHGRTPIAISAWPPSMSPNSTFVDRPDIV